MTKMYEFKFNPSFSLELDLESDKYVLAREYAQPDGSVYSVKFDIKNDYRVIEPVGAKAYITKGSQERIEKELIALNDSKMLETLGLKIPKKQFVETPQRTGENEMNEQLAQSLLAMQETMVKGFEAMTAKNPYEEAIVKGIIDKSKDVSTKAIEEELKAKMDAFIKAEYGALPKSIRIEEGEYKRKEVQGIFHHKFDSILKIISRDVPLMLVGPAGSGKNHTLEQVAEALELDFYFTNAVTQEYTLKGFIDANGTFHETEFYKAFTEGGLFFLDEIDASIPEALITLNAAIANRYFDFPNGRVNAHPNFRVVAAGNTVGTGASSQYVGRSQLDAATLDRFVQIEFDYDPEVESQLAVSEELYKFILGLRKNVERNDVRYVVSMRATINASKLDDLLTPVEIVDNVILKGMTKEDRRMLVSDLPQSKYTKALVELTR